MKYHLPCEDCGSTDALTDYEDHTFCFSCKKSTIKIGRRVIIRDTKKYEGKYKFDHTLSPWMESYFCSKGISLDFLHSMGAYSRPAREVNTDSIAFPCHGNWQLRDKDKKIKSVRTNDNMYYGGLYCQLHQALIIVEDPTSCLKLYSSETGNYECISILGTSLSYHLKLKVITEAKNVIIWLDSDAAGVKAALEIRKEIENYCHVSILSTKKDPKDCSYEEIREALHDQ